MRNEKERGREKERERERERERDKKERERVSLVKMYIMATAWSLGPPCMALPLWSPSS